MSSLESVKGRVVAVENYYYDGLNDSWVMVWNPETLEVEHGPACGYGVQVDGPAWVVAFYTIAKNVRAREAAAKAAAVQAAAEAESEAKRVAWGKVVEVVRGRKVKKGQLATVFWVGESQWGWRVGLELASGERVFTDLGNVEVVEGPAPMMVGAARKAA